MEITDILFSLAFNILSLYIDIRVIKLFLTKREESRLPAGLLYMIVWVENWVIYYLFHDPIPIILSLFIGLFIITMVIFNGSNVKRFLAVVSALALGMISEQIVWNIMRGAEELEKNEALGSMFSAFLSLIIVIILERYFHFDKTIRLSKGSYLNMILISSGSALIGVIIVELSGNHQHSSMMCLSVLCVINVSTYYLYDKINQVYYEKLEKEILEQRINMYQNQFELIRQSQDSIRSLRHDMKNHMLLIGAYISDREYDKAIEYISKIEKHMEISGEYVKTGNKEVDSILNYMLKRADQVGCNITTKLEVPENSFMSEFDLNILLGNLLENALEALEKVVVKRLSIYMRYQQGVLYISIYNTFDGCIKKRGTDFLTTKQDKYNHGLGLRNVKQIVEKYNGELNFHQEEELFKVDIMLYVEVVPM